MSWTDFTPLRRRARVVQGLQLGTGFVFDALIEIGQLFGVGRIVGQTVGAVFQVAHDVVAQRSVPCLAMAEIT
jgi:hypothetical protein